MKEGPVRAKSPMKLVLNPKGKIWDINSMRHSGLVVEPPPLSPEICSNLVRDLNTQNGKGDQNYPRTASFLTWISEFLGNNSTKAWNSKKLR